MKRHQSLLLVASLFFISAYAAQAPTPIKVRARTVSEPVKPDLNKKSSSNDSHITPPHGSGSHSPQAPVVVGGSAHGSGSRSPQALSSGTPTHQSEKRSPIDPFFKTHEGNYDLVTKAPHIEINEGGALQATQRKALFSSSRTAPAAQDDPAQQPSASASLRNSPRQQLRTIPVPSQPQPQPQPASPATAVGLLAAAAAASIQKRHDAQYGAALSAAAAQPTPTPATATQVLPLPSFAGSGSVPDSKQTAEQLSPPSGTATTQASPAHASTRATTMPPSLASTPSPGNSYRAAVPSLVSPTTAHGTITQDTMRATVPTDVVAPPGHTSRGPRIGGFTVHAAPAPQSPWSCPCTIL